MVQHEPMVSNFLCAEIYRRLCVILGVPLSNVVASTLIQVISSMPSDVSVRALMELLRRRRDVVGKARGKINQAFEHQLLSAERPLLELARTGHWHSRRAALQILLSCGISEA